MSAPTTTTGISDEVRELANQEYQYGFVTDLDTDVAPRGLNEDIIGLISAKKMSRIGCWTGGFVPTGTG